MAFVICRHKEIWKDCNRCQFLKKMPPKVQEEKNMEKLVTLISWGLPAQDIENTWAWNNFEEAKKLLQKLTSTLKPTK